MSTGDANGTRNNITAGYKAGSSYQFRNWLGFDLSTVTDNIVSATLEVWSDSQNSDGQAFTWSDVVSDYSQLGTYSTAVFDDLGTGTVFATGTHMSGVVNSFALNSAGIASLNGASGMWAVGGSQTTTSWAFGYTHGVGSYSDDHIKLVLETGVDPIPEPATMVLFACGLLGLAGVSRRK